MHKPSVNVSGYTQRRNLDRRFDISASALIAGVELTLDIALSLLAIGMLVIMCVTTVALRTVI